jgi:FMN-dependent NADH-azoreductase
MTDLSLNVLRVDASGRRNGSTTRRLADAFLNALGEARPFANVTLRDLADGMPFVDESWIGANFTAPEDRSAAQSAILAFSDSLVAELEAADVIVIAAPIYNFSIPASLKAWIDQIARARRTFLYTENGPVGLLENKRAVIIAASGGVEIGSPYDFTTGYLRHILGFIGVTDVSIVAAAGQTVDAERAEVRASEQLEAALKAVTAPLAEAA